ncbi:MAG TPA: hypothetical protein PLK77_00275 [Pyrinomonadaceae bacterium]|nr:hypothetical protein [Pyrinomonadaceae bacterium]
MLSKAIKIAVPFIWFGMVLAISFIEAPLKFQAPGIDLPLGLGIGRLVFFALNKMEIVCSVLLLFAFWRGRSNSHVETGSFGLVLLILVLETVWLLPVLDARAELVISGAEAPFSGMHIVYIVLDLVKLIALMTLGVATARHYLKETKR